MRGLSSFSSQLAAMRREIERNGEAVVRWAELQLLCPDGLTVSEQFHCIAEIARDEKWSFAFLPDKTISFSSLDERPLAPVEAAR